MKWPDMRTAALLLTLAALLATTTAFSRQQAAALSPEFVLAPPKEYTPQYFPHAAWSREANLWLVVWQDGSLTEDPTSQQVQAQDVLAVRIDGNGRVLDPSPLKVASIAGGQQRPMVASDGKDFVVVWHDLRSGSDWDVYMARVTAQGRILDEGGRLLVGGDRNQCFPDIVHGAGTYYVAWLDMRHFPEYRVFGTRVSADGMPLDGRGVELLRTMSDKDLAGWKTAPFAPGKKGAGWHQSLKQPGPPSLSTNGTTHLLTSKYRDDVAVRAIDAATGKKKGEGSHLNFHQSVSGVRMTTFWNSLRHTATSNGFLTATYQYATAFGATGAGLWASARLDRGGQPFTGIDNAIVPVVVDTNQRFPPGYRTFNLRNLSLDIAWDGKRALIASEQHRHGSGRKALSETHTPGNIDVHAIFVNERGKRLVDPAANKATDADEFQKNGTELILPDGVTIEPVTVATGPSTQSNPAIAAGQEGTFLVVWQEESPSTDSRIMGRLVKVKSSTRLGQ